MEQRKPSVQIARKKNAHEHVQSNFSSACFIKELYDIITRYHIFTHIYGNYVNAHLMFCNYSKYITIQTNRLIKNSNPSAKTGEKTLTLPLPDCPMRLFLRLFLPVPIPGCHRGAVTFIPTRMVLRPVPTATPFTFVMVSSVMLMRC